MREYELERVIDSAAQLPGSELDDMLETGFWTAFALSTGLNRSRLYCILHYLLDLIMHFGYSTGLVVCSGLYLMLGCRLDW